MSLLSNSLLSENYARDIVKISAVALVFVAIAGLYLYHRACPRPIPGIPHDVEAAQTYSGDLTSLLKSSDGLAKWCSKQLGKLGSPVCQVRLGPFKSPIVLVADVGDARDQMMVSSFERSTYIIDRFPLFGQSQIRMHTDEDWKRSRSWLKDLLSPSFMKTVAGPAIHSSVRQLIELWTLCARISGPNHPFSMTMDLKLLALDVMTQFHHGEDFPDLALQRQVQFVKQMEQSSHNPPLGPGNGITFPRAPMNEFGQGVTEIGDRMADIYAMSSPPGIVSWWTRYAMSRYRRFFASKQRIMEAAVHTSARRLRQGETARNGIDHMVYQEDKAALKTGRRPLHQDQIMIDEAFGNHIAGLHTTSSAMCWIMKYLSQEQDVQRRLREELNKAFPIAVQENNRLPTCVEIMNAKLPYLQAVIEETLRLRAAFLIARDTARDTQTLGYMIPKGTVCLLVCQGLENVAGLAKQSKKGERHFPGKSNPDLEAFDPERWLVRKGEDVTFDGSSNPQMAFGLGLRGCWGRKVAELEMTMMSTLVVWSFDALPVNADLASHEAIYDFSYRAKRGYLLLRKRQVADASVD